MKKFRYCLTILLIIFTFGCIGCGTSSNVRVNLDLTGLSSYGVQSEVLKMQKPSTAGSYLGKNIKMKVKHYASGNYHYVIGPGGDECCNWEIEVKLSDTVTSYPKTDKTITITGKYRYYKEEGRTYYYLELLDC